MTIGSVVMSPAVKERTEAELIETFRRTRAPEDFEPLIALALDKVRGVVYRITLNPDDVNDMVQEAWIKAYQRFDSFRGKSSFSTWVCQIAVNHTLNYLRRRNRTVQPDETLFDRRPAGASSHPTHDLERAEHRQAVDRAMARLPLHLRSVLVLSVIENMETDDIAAACGCNKATVYWRLHKARKELRLLMNRELVEVLHE